LLKPLLTPRKPTNSARDLLHLEQQPATVYAIGDVHGCLEQLRRLHDLIVADAAGRMGSKLIVMLGDYVDRGPQSAGVIDFLLSPPPDGFERICLCGNHEQMMLDYLSSPATGVSWLGYGGAETLFSYGIAIDAYRSASVEVQRQMLRDHIPEEHRGFMARLPSLLSTPQAVFTHAGLRDGIALNEQVEADLLWRRYRPDEANCGFPLLVHGHTPQAQPINLPNRICVDTGCFATGILTAVRLSPGAAPHFISMDHAGDDRQDC
jgi:serine/threonine protein phosphatase 1